MIRCKTAVLYPVGADGSAACTYNMSLGRPGFVRAISIDYVTQPSTTDIVVKADTSSGATLFTNTSSNTDVAASPVGMPGIDEGNAATAATDGLSGGFPFADDLYITVAQGDGHTNQTKYITMKFWIEF